MVIPLDTNDNNENKKLGNICWGGSIEGIDCGDEVAEWLSWNMDRPGLRLVRCTSRNPPDINNKYYGKLSLLNILLYSIRELFRQLYNNIKIYTNYTNRISLIKHFNILSLINT